MNRTNKDILCPKCRNVWDGNESDALFRPYATCTNCGQRFRADEVTVWVTEPLTERWITRTGPTWGGRRHKTRGAAEKSARLFRHTHVQRVLFSSEGFTVLETFEVTP